MESSRTSNASTATTTNVTMASVSPATAATAAPTAPMDKPDELVSSGEIHQMSSSQGQHGEPVAPASANHHHHHHLQLHPHSSQHKKCLHHRIFDANNTNAMNERVAALNALLHQVTQQNLTQGTQLIQRPFPLQQTASSQQQSLVMRQQHQHQHSVHPYQQYPMQQQMPTTIGLSNSTSANGGTGGTHFTVGIANPSINSSAAAAAAASTSGPIIHNQNGLVQKMNAALLAERYLLLDLVEGSTLYKCIDVKTHEELVCKVSFDNETIYHFNKTQTW